MRRHLVRAVGLLATVTALTLGAATAATAGEVTPAPATISGVDKSGDMSIEATDRSIRCAQAGQAAGWSGNTLVTAVAIALAESGCTANAQGWNGPTSGCPNGSVDRGAWQINSCYHAEVSDACAYDLYCNARAAHTIWGYSGWGAWSTYNNGAYLNYWSEAQAGVSAIGGGVYGTVNTGGGSLNVRSGPGTSYALVGSVANGSTVHIYCQTHGEWIYSEVWAFWTDLWDRIGTGQYVTDAYVDTGSNGQVAPSC